MLCSQRKVYVQWLAILIVASADDVGSCKGYRVLSLPVCSVASRGGVPGSDRRGLSQDSPSVMLHEADEPVRSLGKRFEYRSNIHGCLLGDQLLELCASLRLELVCPLPIARVDRSLHAVGQLEKWVQRRRHG